MENLVVVGQQQISGLEPENRIFAVIDNISHKV
jgi:hypothetical protein